jgi:hypothetical protein
MDLEITQPSIDRMVEDRENAIPVRVAKILWR